MKRISLIFIVVLLILGGCSKNEIKKIEDLKNEYETDKTNVDVAAEYIDMLLLEDQKEEAYKVLNEAASKATDQEKFLKLKEYTKYFELREVVTNYYDQNNDLTNVSYTRYDDKGRIIQKGDTSRIYPDDGGDTYYYTLDSYMERKTCYDKQDRIIYAYFNAFYIDDDVVPFNDIYSICDKYTYEYDNNGNVVKQTMTEQTANKILYSYIETYKYDELNNVIESEYYHYDENGNITSSSNETFEYDEHNNLISSTSNNSNYININNYTNEYDSDGYLIKQTISYDSGHGYTTYTDYTYDKLFDLVLKEKGEYNTVEHIYELVTPTASGIGLFDDALTFVSGNATRAVTKREILATNIKVRKTPTTHEDNFIENVSKGTVVSVYDSVYNEGYIWHEIGLNKWIADDGTWTKAVN